MAVSEKKKASNRSWDKQNMTIIGVTVRNTLKEEFRAVCEQNGTTMNAVLLKALHDYMGEAEQPAPAPFPFPRAGRSRSPSSSEPSAPRTGGSWTWTMTAGPTGRGSPTRPAR